MSNTQIFPVYVLRDADVNLMDVPQHVHSAFRSWVEGVTPYGPLDTSEVRYNMGNSVAAEFAIDGEVYQAPYYVDLLTLEVSGGKMPYSFSMILIAGSAAYRVGVDTDLKEMANLAHARPTADEEPTAADIAKGCLDINSLLRSVVVAAATYPNMSFVEVDSHLNPVREQIFIANVGK